MRAFRLVRLGLLLSSDDFSGKKYLSYELCEGNVATFTFVNQEEDVCDELENLNLFDDIEEEEDEDENVPEIIESLDTSPKNNKKKAGILKVTTESIVEQPKKVRCNVAMEAIMKGGSTDVKQVTFKTHTTTSSPTVSSESPPRPSNYHGMTVPPPDFSVPPPARLGIGLVTPPQFRPPQPSHVKFERPPPRPQPPRFHDSLFGGGICTGPILPSNHIDPPSPGVHSSASGTTSSTATNQLMQLLNGSSQGNSHHQSNFSATPSHLQNNIPTYSLFSGPNFQQLNSSEHPNLFQSGPSPLERLLRNPKNL